MPDREEIRVDPHDARQRLDRYLAARGRWGSRSQVQRLIAEGHVRIDGQPAKPGLTLRPGQLIEVRNVPAPVTAGVEPEPIALDVLFEDAWLLVINKPAGLVVHPAPGHWQGTLVSALLYHWQGTRPGLDSLRPGIVHRLDKDTSGVLVIAKDAATLTALAAQFRAREVEKRYVACVWGRVRRDSGTISAPIGRNPVHRKRMAVRSGGREAMTYYEVVWRSDTMSGLRLFPKTGRTHQLRVHLAAIGHPIVGDAVYGRGRARPVPIARHALHAEQITVCHPHTGERMRFTATVPQDLRILSRL
ncbi:MAG TPA: RluA family pseudouridine synthase [Candidatus Margulisiibacteriota bacterium]|nr:RluA family pseudouridine synthase [Candidatus Margulisiibacteriota bacterium]